MRTRVTRKMFRPAAFAASLSLAAVAAPAAMAGQIGSFGTVANFNVPGGGVAEIVAATPDGNTLLYTDAANNRVGVVDISEPSAPRQVATIPVGGSPTSVAVSKTGARAFVAVQTTQREEGEAPEVSPGRLVVINIAARTAVSSVEIGNGPDSVATTRIDGVDVAVVAIENEPLVVEDGVVTDDELPGHPGDISGPGLVQVVAFESEGPRVIDLPIAGRPDLPSGLLFPEDPQPEFVSIRGEQAAVTLQENNGIAIIDVRKAVEGNGGGHGPKGHGHGPRPPKPPKADPAITKIFELGRAADRPADLLDNDEVDFSQVYPRDVGPEENADPGVRTPDAIAWSEDGSVLYTADEGEGAYSGGRGWSAWDARTGKPVWEETTLEQIAARFGQYPDSRSDAKGIEIEGLATTVIDGRPYALVGSERGSFLAVYDISDPREPVFTQLLPTGVEPEGILAVPNRSLLVTSAEGTGNLTIFEGRSGGPGGTAERPQISAADASDAWAALSGLAADLEDENVLWGVPDDALPSALYRIDVAGRNASLTRTPILKDGAQALYDLEGVAVDTSVAAPADKAGFWVASEGNAAFGAANYRGNLLIQVDADGNVLREVALPEAIDSPAGGVIRSNGYEGVTVSDSGRHLLAPIQREYASDAVVDGVKHARIARYDLVAERWDFFLYPLDKTTTSGDWIGLSEITNLGGDRYAVIERDKLQGGQAKVKRVYEFTLDGVEATDGSPIVAGASLSGRVIKKTLLRDVRSQTAPFEKIEGLAITSSGRLWTAVDNDGGLHESRIARAGEVEPEVDLWLSLLHNNDGESKLLPTGDEGGAARFATLIDQLRDGAERRGGSEASGAVVVSSGDNFLAGPQFNASLTRGTVPFFDSVFLNRVGYDALAIGNHEFDFGPDTLADVIEGTDKTGPWISANLDVTGEPRLDSLRRRGRIAASAVVNIDGRKVGVVGATTPRLPQISTPRNVVVGEVTEAVQAEVDRLRQRGVRIIVLSSHLQSIEEDVALAPYLRGVDIMIAGGGDELLANDDDLLQPTDAALAATARPYPVQARDAEGRTVPVVTTSGDLRYIGRLIAGFDARGNLVRVSEESGPVRVIGGDHRDAVQDDQATQRDVVDPVQESGDALAENRLADTQVQLDGRRGPGIRTQETNLGNLVADSMLFSGRRVAAEAGLPAPAIAFHNGGGIRNNNVFPAELSSGITELDTFAVLPFSNFVSVIPSVTRAQLKDTLEHSVSNVEQVDGRFLQLSGLRIVWDPTKPVGQRIITATLDSGEQLIANGQVVAGAALSIATIDFTAGGGDGFTTLASIPYHRSSVPAQQAFRDFLTTSEAEGGLGGQVTAAAYPEVPAGANGTRIIRQENVAITPGGGGETPGENTGGENTDGGETPGETPAPSDGSNGGSAAPAAQGSPAPAGPAAPGASANSNTTGTSPVRVTLRPSFALVARGGQKTVRVRVAATRALAGRTVAIERKAGKRVVRVGTAKVGRNGVANATVRLGAGVHRLRVRVSATSTTRAASTAFHPVRVPTAVR